ncbi:hypothetical protein L596_007256 [Steinernema carpocapsae]|uniref:Uncharacterized protein n=1 Tax=Steinernema carpocapsae TaxID=34508 RepID=A0A4U5P945_STECR|nr:hypothetical protein L596_007256 [Steinernema carpocapsae]
MANKERESRNASQERRKRWRVVAQKPLKPFWTCDRRCDLNAIRNRFESCSESSPVQTDRKILRFCAVFACHVHFSDQFSRFHCVILSCTFKLMRDRVFKLTATSPRLSPACCRAKTTSLNTLRRHAGDSPGDIICMERAPNFLKRL